MIFRLPALLAVMVYSTTVAGAQTPPSSSEIASYTGLHAAAWAGRTGEIERLLAGDADPNAIDGAGRTPLHVAAFASHEDAATALVKGGGDPNLLDHERYDIITIAAVADDAEMVRHAIELGGNPGNTTSVYDGTALIAAAHLGHFEVVRALIEAGAPLDHVNNLGWTALIEAVILGDGKERHIKTVRALVEAGAERTIADRQGLTPLDHARQRGYADMVSILESAG